MGSDVAAVAGGGRGVDPREGGAIAVIVVRGDDTVMAVHEDAAPHDAAETVRDLLAEMAEEANQERREKRARKVAGYE